MARQFQPRLVRPKHQRPRGVGATDTSTLFNWSSRYVGVGPGARWLLFDAGRVLANVDSRQAVREELLADYQQTILVAVRDVEDGASRSSGSRTAAIYTARPSMQTLSS